jgi:hypothetical protein
LQVQSHVQIISLNVFMKIIVLTSGIESLTFTMKKEKQSKKETEEATFFTNALGSGKKG